MVFEVTILGSSAAMPGWGRNLAAQLVNYEQQLFLVDCGEGTQHQLLRYRVRLGRIRHILISHLHGDHYLGLPGLLSTMQLLGRTEPLHLHAPPDLAEWLTGQFRLSQAYLAYPLLFHPLPAPGGVPVYVGDTLVVTTLPTDHRIEGYGFLFREKDRLRKIIKERLPPDLPIEGIQALKRGLDVAHHGQLLRNDDHTTPPLPPLAYAYCSDTKFSPELAPWVAGVDLLYHEATFADDFAARAQETYHSTARQAAELAQLAGAKKLLLGHFSVRYRDLSPLLDQAREVFANAHLAIEGQTFSVNGQLTSQI
jgi:ribonuclease Z